MRLGPNGNAVGAICPSLAIDCALSGDNVLIPAVAGRSIRVFRIAFTLAGGNVRFLDGAGGTALSGPMAAAAGVLEDMPLGNPIYVTTPGNAFVANLSGANQLSGTVWYTVQPS